MGGGLLNSGTHISKAADLSLTKNLTRTANAITAEMEGLIKVRGLKHMVVVGAWRRVLVYKSLSITSYIVKQHYKPSQL
jgi:hypothetical protein